VRGHGFLPLNVKATNVLHAALETYRSYGDEAYAKSKANSFLKRCGVDPEHGPSTLVRRDVIERVVYAALDDESGELFWLLLGSAIAIQENLENWLFSSVQIKKWDFEKHIYESVENKYGAKLVTYPFDPDEIIRCTNCGKEITAEESMVSKQWHNEIGFGFPVCVECYQTEWKKYRAEKEKNKAHE